MVALMQPQLGEIIQDPAAGTGGFLIAADRYIKRAHRRPVRPDRGAAGKFQRNTFYGMELVPDAHRLALMNLMLHGIEGRWITTATPFAEGEAPAQGRP